MIATMASLPNLASRLVGAGLFWCVISPALGQSIFEITPFPEPPRGGVGTFQQRWIYRVEKEPQSGIASFYTDIETASGENLRPYDTKDLTCSHPNKSELGQRYRVSREGKSITCRVSDIGPSKRLGRALDMTPAGAAALGITKEMGLAQVTIERLPPNMKPKRVK